MHLPTKAIAVATTGASFAGAIGVGSANADVHRAVTKVTSSQIKNNTIRSVDLNKHLQKQLKLRTRPAPRARPAARASWARPDPRAAEESRASPV